VHRFLGQNRRRNRIRNRSLAPTPTSFLQPVLNLGRMTFLSQYLNPSRCRCSSTRCSRDSAERSVLANCASTISTFWESLAMANSLRITVVELKNRLEGVEDFTIADVQKAYVWTESENI